MAQKQTSSLESTIPTWFGVVLVVVVAALSGFITGWILTERINQVSTELQEQIIELRQEIQSTKTTR